MVATGTDAEGSDRPGIPAPLVAASTAWAFQHTKANPWRG